MDKERKIKILKVAYQLIKSKKYTGLCVAIHEASEYKVLLESFPEITAYKPKDSYDFMYWFNTGFIGRYKRLRILKKVIKQLKTNKYE